MSYSIIPMSFSENKITKNTFTGQTGSSICEPKLFDLQPIENNRIEASFTASEISSYGCLLRNDSILKMSVGRFGKPIKRYHTFTYKAGGWENQQRVIAKIEVSAKGTNIRFIVTDLWEYTCKVQDRKLLP